MKVLFKYIISALLCFLIPVLRCAGNEYKVNIRLIIKDSEVVLNNDFRVYLLSGVDTVNTRVEKSSFYISNEAIPDSGVTICIDYKSFRLTFGNVIISKKRQEVKWEIKIVKKPFDKQEYWYIRKKIKRIKWLYTLNMGDGGVITEYRYTKAPDGIK